MRIRETRFSLNKHHFRQLCALFPEIITFPMCIYGCRGEVSTEVATAELLGSTYIPLPQQLISILSLTLSDIRTDIIVIIIILYLRAAFLRADIACDISICVRS